jgi:hypothetical protein
VSEKRRVVQILPSSPPSGMYSIYLDGAYMGVGNRADIEAVCLRWGADFDPTPFGAVIDDAARAGVEALRAEIEELRNPVRSKPRDPPPSFEELKAAYKAAKAAGRDNREAQDKYVQNIHGPLPKLTRETARREAKVGGKPGPKPEKTLKK